VKPNMSAILKQAQKVQEEMQKVQENLENITVEATAGGGMVKVVANCKYRIQSIHIDPEVIKSDDKEMLEDLIIAAVNQAITAAQQKSNEEMEKITGGLLGGMNLPGGMKFPGL
jgi:DNA-binding YbaB/EbfC family protein